MKLKRSKTKRGFAHVEFSDLYDQECSLQDSSLATRPALWFGVDWMLGDPGDEFKTVNGYKLTQVCARMHLTQAMAKKLIVELQRFVDTGSVGRR